MNAPTLTPADRKLAAGIAGAAGGEIPMVAAGGHTPGPWSLFRTETGWIVNQAGGTGYVCTLSLISHRAEECKANANLIAAAPLMLDALKAVLADVQSIDTDSFLSPEVGQQLRAAIAAATKAAP